MKHTLLFFCITHFSPTAEAQLIPNSIIDKYPAGVVSRVYEISLVTLIDSAKQTKLANFFMKKDSLITNAAKGAISVKSSKSQIDSMEIEFENILDAEERFKYNFFKYQRFFEADAKMEAGYIKKKYSTSSDIATSIQKLNISKNQRVLKALTSNSNLSDLPDSNMVYYHKYDSILSKYLITAQGEQYFNQKLKELAKVKPVSAKNVEELRKNYENLCLKNGANYHKNFNAAMQICIPDSAYYKTLFQDSIAEVARLHAKKEIEEYIYKYSLNDDARNKITPIIFEKANKTVWLETRYQFTRKRDSLQIEVSETAWARIKNELIRLGYTQLDKSRFVNAIRFKDVLHLSKPQIDTLIGTNLSNDLTINAYKTLNKGAYPDFGWYVAAQLKLILTEGQYDTLLLIESQPQAIANAKYNWEELKKFNLTTGVDSVSTVRSIVAYHISLITLADRYAGDRATYNKLARATRQTKPEILKRLDAVKKEDENIEKK